MITRFTLIGILAALCAAITAVSAQAESQSHALSENGLERNYLVYRPANLGHTAAAPLVIVLHGGYGTGARAEKAYHWDDEANKAGFAVAYPDGINHSWNAGGICCGPAMRNKIDDLSFITDLIETLVQTENIDPHRVYLTGISNGAAMSYRYACEGSFPVAAIGAVAGSFSFACPQPRAISVMEIHGLEDQNIPMSGGIGSKGVTKVSWQPVEQTIRAFRTANNCSTSKVEQNGDVKTETSSCANEHQVVLITIAGAGHQWPGAKPKTLVQRLMGLDPPSTALDATSTLWAFFEEQQTGK